MTRADQTSLSELFQNKRILITGSSGYIAWNLIRQLMEFECTIVCFSRKADKIAKQKGKANLEFIEGSYQDLIVFKKAVINVNIIFHLASQTSVYEAEKDPLGDYEANVKPMQLLLEACRKKANCPIIIFSGTSTQCGMPEKLPVDENVIDHPITTYDFHKLQAERWLKFYTKQGWVKGVSLRLTNVYGPGPKSSSADRGILNKMISKAIREEELTIYGTGDYLRDYIYIEDVVSALLLATIHIKDLNGKHFILGSGEGTTINDAITMVGELVSHHTGKIVAVKRVEMPPDLLKIEFRNFIADVSSLKQQATFDVHYSLENGINKTIDFCYG